MAKRIILYATLFCVSFCVPTFASPKYNTSVEMNQKTPRAEVTKWYYRTHNGAKQKRLWSITYGYWITEWEEIK